jgi:hypothetical protein
MLPSTSAGNPDIQKLERVALTSHVLSSTCVALEYEPAIRLVRLLTLLIHCEAKGSIIAFR